MIILEITAPIKKGPQQQETKPNTKTKPKEKTVSFEDLLNMAMGKN